MTAFKTVGYLFVVMMLASWFAILMATSKEMQVIMGMLQWAIIFNWMWTDSGHKGIGKRNAL